APAPPPRNHRPHRPPARRPSSSPVDAPTLGPDLGPGRAGLAQRLERLRARVLRGAGGLHRLLLGPLAAREVEGPQPRLEQAGGALQVVVDGLAQLVPAQAVLDAADAR